MDSRNKAAGGFFGRCETTSEPSCQLNWAAKQIVGILRQVQVPGRMSQRVAVAVLVNFHGWSLFSPALQGVFRLCVSLKYCWKSWLFLPARSTEGPQRDHSLGTGIPSKNFLYGNLLGALPAQVHCSEDGLARQGTWQGKQGKKLLVKHPSRHHHHNTTWDRESRGKL